MSSLLSAIFVYLNCHCFVCIVRYFDEDDDSAAGQYRPSPDSSPCLNAGTFCCFCTVQGFKVMHLFIISDSDEEDPLDAFMQDLNKKVNQEQTKSSGKEVKGSKEAIKGVRHDIEEEDDEESYYRYIKENPLAGLQADESDSEQIEYDEDGNPIRPTAKKVIDPLPPVDHSTIQYQPFEKNFYEEHDDIKAQSDDKLAELVQTLGLKVTGISVPKPVCSFAHFGFDENLMNSIRKSEFTQPTPIQVTAI